MKKNNTKLYARALAQVLEKPARHNATALGGEESDKIINNFVKLLVEQGYEKKAGEILNLAENMLLAKQGKKKITFETARKTTASQKKMLEGIAEDGDIIKEKINPELVAGVKIVVDGNKQLDCSMLRKLQNIF